MSKAANIIVEIDDVKVTLVNSDSLSLTLEGVRWGMRIDPEDRISIAELAKRLAQSELDSIEANDRTIWLREAMQTVLGAANENL